MPTYQLQIKQVVDYPRCRIYRQFVRFLMEDRSIRVSGGSGLFYFTVLCSYANFRTSYRRIDGISYTVYPGEWVCTLKELSQWFRTRFQCQALAVLERLQKQNLISFQTLGRGNVVRYKICDWARHNTVLEYNAPCQKDTGFFFLPVSVATDLISSDRCSEMDIVLDLWVSAIYNDNQVQGSDLGPVVYFRNGTGNPLVTYTELAARWGLSRATVGRILKKLAALDYLSLMSFPGRHGSVIYLQKYLSTMFEISDVMMDKEEVAMTLNISSSGLPRRKSPRPRSAGGLARPISRLSLMKYAAMKSAKSCGPRKIPKRSVLPRPIRRKRKQRSALKRSACLNALPMPRSRSPPASIRWRIICPSRR